ncbi:MAG: class B sortase [Clostridium sp.]|nr:class B sortase [Acetatifactor muris]MCM1527844.1 class B sortase [Bacteroides sp.]MCM1563344.1 class B sortase [Clostridium sp.]
MARNEYIVEDRSFRTEADYKRALRDKDTMDRLRKESAKYTEAELERLLKEVREGRYPFYTLLGQDFEDELEERIRGMQKGAGGSKTGRGARRADTKTKADGHPPGTLRRAGRSPAAAPVQVSEEAVREELRRRERRRKWTVLLCMAGALVCLGYFAVYSYFYERTERDNEKLLALKEQEPIALRGQSADGDVVIHYTGDEEREIPEVLDEYKNLLIKNKKLIGWVKIDDTKINYPVMQTSDNEYYLTHNLDQEYDRNGSIFMDKDCDVLKPSTNLILYGHHMQSGKMFGDLDKYSDQKYYEDHRYIDFDTIYEKGIYEVMYVFRSRVYSEEEVVFKYYQFIDAMSETEFDSNMNEMAAVSLYDTGVTASYGDRLLTLSTCDYQEKNGRFVVVAKKVLAKE